MSLKSLADGVLERNRERNQRATGTENAAQLEKVQAQGKVAQLGRIAQAPRHVVERWDPDYAAKGYVWCLDCVSWNGKTCSHSDNPFRNQQPLAPRKCRWYSALKLTGGDQAHG